MTVGEALARAEELRPGCQITARTRQRWLVELDGMLREKFFKNCPEVQLRCRGRGPGMERSIGGGR